MNNSFDLEKLVRPNIGNLTPYRSARDDFDKGLLLDANENSMGPPFPKAEGLNRYPSPYQETLKKRFAKWRNVDPEQIFTGVGSDEAIDLLFRIFCEPGRDRILTTPPTYGMYGVSASINNVEVDEVLMTDTLQLDVPALLDAVTPQTKLLFLCSPNNPTGNTLPQQQIETVLNEFSGIVVLDEAYIDFSDSKSWAGTLDGYPNLVVLQTMSKSFGLAGIRLGIALASKEIINYMTKVKAPYNVNALTSSYANAAFDHLDQIEEHIRIIKEQREWLRKKLARISAVQNIFPSQANFLLAKIEGAKKVYQQLAERGVIVRFRGNEPHCENCLRITVGTPDENQQLIETLKEVTS